ncbi:MAG: hypothetical protein H0V76_08120 [Blastocatellia bacterium]|nr:hypothetical protein [Blastocatellia bacterium]
MKVHNVRAGQDLQPVIFLDPKKKLEARLQSQRREQFAEAFSMLKWRDQSEHSRFAVALGRFLKLVKERPLYDLKTPGDANIPSHLKEKTLKDIQSILDEITEGLL